MVKFKEESERINQLPTMELIVNLDKHWDRVELIPFQPTPDEMTIRVYDQEGMSVSFNRHPRDLLDKNYQDKIVIQHTRSTYIGSFDSDDEYTPSEFYAKMYGKGSEEIYKSTDNTMYEGYTIIVIN